MTGLIVFQSLASTPFVFLLMGAALRSMAPALEEAAATAGATPLASFRRVTLPLLLPGLLAPVILIALVTLEQFELPLIIGLPARINVFAYRIYNELNPAGGLPNYGGAAAIALPFLGFSILGLMLYNAAIRRADRFVVVTGKAYHQRPLRLGRWRPAALALMLVYIALAMALPAAILAWTSLFGYAAPSRAVIGAGSLASYLRLLSDAVFWRAVGNTIIAAGLSALIATAVGAVIGWIVTRTRLPGRGALDVLSFLSTGIPSVIVALAVLLLYLSLPVGLYGTVWVLVLAFSYRIAATTRIARAGLIQIHPELEEAAAVSGIPWLAAQWRIVLPLLRPALLSGFVLLFVVGMREFTIPLVLYSQENVVLPVLLWQLYQNGEPGPSAALSTMIMLMVLPLVFFARRLMVTRAA
jgi:iron(III) transport system permease protein